MSLQLSFSAATARHLTVLFPNPRHSFRMAVSLCLATMMFLSSLVVTASAHGESTPKSGVEDVDSFIIEFANGSTACRAATLAEIPATRPRPGDVGIPVQQLRPKEAPANQLRAAESDNAATGLTINFVALSQLQNDADRNTVIAAFERAAAVWTNRIKSPITVSIAIDYGTNLPGGDAFDDNVIGSTSSRRTLIDYPGARTNLLAGSSGSAETTIYNRLPGSFIPTDVGNGAVVSVSRSVAFALGIPVPSAFDPNVATIAFNKNFPFDFNPDDGITFNQTDFIAVAVHEIGHALGFTSGAGQGPTSNPTLWDIFRLRPGTNTTTFTTAERVLSIGGEQVHFTGENFSVEGLPTTELRLSTGGPEPKVGDGDRRQSSHWKDDGLNSGRFIGIMDPTIASGDHEEATENDFAALERIGWNLISPVAPPPAPPAPPPPANNNFASAQVISGCSGSVGGTNVGATREAGETQNHSPDNGGGNRSVWYSWQAPSSGSATISTTGSRFDTVLGVYTGSTVSSISPVTQVDGTVGKDDDDNGGNDKTSTVTFNASAGTVYRIAVDGYDNNSGGDFGPITLNWSCTAVSAPIQLLLEESGPAVDQVAAFDSILHLRDPFPVVNTANLFFPPLTDQTTRVVIFVAEMQLPAGAPLSAVTINLVDSNNASHNVGVQDFRPVPNQPWTQITFRLPNPLPPGTCKIKVVTASQVSNTATIRISN